MKGLIAVLGLLASSCAFDHATITVEADEPIRSASLTLNGEKVAMERNTGNSFSAKWRGGEASGELVVSFNDGTQSSCRVGYLEGSSFYREEFRIVGRACDYVPSEKSTAGN